MLQSMMDIGISGPMVLFNWDCNQRQSSIAFSKIKLVSSTAIQAQKTLKRKSEEIMEMIYQYPMEILRKRKYRIQQLYK